MLQTIIFDVNETLLDLSALDGRFQHIFGNASVKKEWFMQVLQSALVLNALEKYEDFATVAKHALKMTASSRQTPLTKEDISTISTGMRTLPPHPDVAPGLQRLAEAGFRLAALTNSNLEMANAQLRNAGIDHFFDEIMSVESVQRFKPNKAVYDMAAKTLGENPSNLMMVAAHEWDTSGAICAGWSAAFIARPGKTLGPLSETPGIVGKDLLDVATQIIENHRQE